MWFNILKLNLDSLQSSVGDTQATDINIKTNSKCKEKLQNFTNKLESSGLHFDRKINNIDDIDEELACIVVEMLDEHFLSRKLYVIPNNDGFGMALPNKGVLGASTRKDFNLKDMQHSIYIETRFSPVIDPTRIVIFDIIVENKSAKNIYKQKITYLSYKISTLDRSMTAERIKEEGRAIGEFRNIAENEYGIVWHAWRNA